MRLCIYECSTHAVSGVRNFQNDFKDFETINVI